MSRICASVGVASAILGIFFVALQKFVGKTTKVAIKHEIGQERESKMSLLEEFPREGIGSLLLSLWILRRVWDGARVLNANWQSIFVQAVCACPKFLAFARVVPRSPSCGRPSKALIGWL